MYLINVYHFINLDKDRWTWYTEGDAWESPQVNWRCSPGYCEFDHNLASETFFNYFPCYFWFIGCKIPLLKLWRLWIVIWANFWFSCQVLFNDTIFHNIHYGSLSATAEEVRQVLLSASVMVSKLCTVDGLYIHFDLFD